VNRSEVRHALYRIKNGAPKAESKHIYDVVEPLIPANEQWGTFADNWDVTVVDSKISVIRPETDYDFVHSTCIEMSICAKSKTIPDFTDRQLNVIQMVESTMLEGKMKWETYNKSWGLTLDGPRKYVHTKLFATSVNTVTDEMIKNSAKSDGAAMVSPGEVPVTTFTPTPFTPTEREKAMIDAMLKGHPPA
jgi:hypothetical protein